jgi:glutathionyl-hydroquinone reductase
MSAITSADGSFNRAPSSFRSQISKDGEFPPEIGRYWLYVSYAVRFKSLDHFRCLNQTSLLIQCPWVSSQTQHNSLCHRLRHFILSQAHRTLITRELKGLSSVIGVLVVHPHMGALGWPFFAEEGAREISGFTSDTLNQSKYMRDLYFKDQPEYKGRYVKLETHTSLSH